MLKFNIRNALIQHAEDNKHRKHNAMLLDISAYTPSNVATEVAILISTWKMQIHLN
jgi:hypothetical protein